MLLGNYAIHCCYRTLFRATLNCTPLRSSSLFKPFSHSASLVLPTTCKVLLESITRGKLVPEYLKCRGNTATLIDWSHAKMSHSDHGPSAPPTLNFDILKSHKFDEDILLYSNSNEKECVVYNVISLAALGLMSYAAFKIYTKASLDAVEDNRKQLGNIIGSKSLVPFYRYFDLNPYREVMSGASFLFGCVVFAAILRYTLRCVHHLTLLRDGKTIAVTTSNVWGRPVTRRVPVNQAHLERLNYLVRGHDSCLLHVRGTRVAYALDMRGKLHEPFLIRQYLDTEKENKEKDGPLY